MKGNPFIITSLGGDFRIATGKGQDSEILTQMAENEGNPPVIINS